MFDSTWWWSSVEHCTGVAFEMHFDPAGRVDFQGAAQSIDCVGVKLLIKPSAFSIIGTINGDFGVKGLDLLRQVPKVGVHLGVFCGCL